MPEFRIIFTETRGVNIIAVTEEEAKQIVKSREWEYGMDWSEDEIDIVSSVEI
jgi:hypothetical protein